MTPPRSSRQCSPVVPAIGPLSPGVGLSFTTPRTSNTYKAKKTPTLLATLATNRGTPFFDSSRGHKFLETALNSSEGAAERKGKKLMLRVRSKWSTCTFLLDHVAHGRQKGEDRCASAAEKKGSDAADAQDAQKEELQFGLKWTQFCLLVGQ
ncbi:uncharacterized protein LOC123410330 isoform X2 [Hordeum vulgare subsp. vulgare]|uniref:uncharacterized protein LOC123410330 isoform X2 n=1 Tax=Hordeum vulgare subsp. vulgare TaxID=112509 RepID=UPI001D1A41FE|nr:uncharacterized protein LOC123410330 isoform X2 [Hordeum vulgare subsp. vulgare]